MFTFLVFPLLFQGCKPLVDPDDGRINPSRHHSPAARESEPTNRDEGEDQLCSPPSASSVDVKLYPATQGWANRASHLGSAPTQLTLSSLLPASTSPAGHDDASTVLSRVQAQVQASQLQSRQGAMSTFQNVGAMPLSKAAVAAVALNPAVAALGGIPGLGNSTPHVSGPAAPAEFSQASLLQALLPSLGAGGAASIPQGQLSASNNLPANVAAALPALQSQLGIQISPALLQQSLFGNALMSASDVSMSGSLGALSGPLVKLLSNASSNLSSSSNQQDLPSAGQNIAYVNGSILSGSNLSASNFRGSNLGGNNLRESQLQAQLRMERSHGTMIGTSRLASEMLGEKGATSSLNTSWEVEVPVKRMKKVDSDKLELTLGL